jgi:hypothetical protein
VDALYFRVSSERQTTETQFEDLLQLAEKDDSGRNWAKIRDLLSACVHQENVTLPSGGIRTVYSRL